jgi:adenine-specific DNA methylase
MGTTEDQQTDAGVEAEAEAQQKQKQSSSSSSSKSDKSFAHFADAIRAVAARVVFLSENDARDVEDHLIAATGSGDEAKEAQKRIAERNPE